MKKRLVITTVVLSIITLVSILTVAVALPIAFFNSDRYQDYRYATHLEKAIENQDVAEVERLVQERPSCINTVPALMPEWVYVITDSIRPTYSLVTACSVGNLDIVQILINAGVDLNGIEGWVPLSVTYRNKQSDEWYEISKLLIDSGALLDYVTESSGGKSALLQDIVSRSYQATESDMEVIASFNYALENCDHSKVNWMRVLQHSVSNDRIEIVKLLLDKGYCDVNDTSVGTTALMFAARDSTLEMVRLLLDYGADKSYISDNGKTAYDYAVESGTNDIIALLENWRQGGDKGTVLLSPK